jgi:hypothetical protein
VSRTKEGTNEMLKRALLMLLAISPGMVSANDTEWINAEVIIRGDYFHAATVAYQDYRSKLFERLTFSGPTPPTPDQTKFSEYLLKIENYNIEVSDGGRGGSHYVVRIYPRLSQDHPVVFGGDGIYILDASTFKIIEKHYGK